MQTIKLALLNEDDSKNLFDFEIKNKIYFEKHVPPRNKDYYTYCSYLQYHQSLLDEIDNNLGYYYVIKTQNEEIIGRINLTYIDATTCELGYRIGESYTGKGIAKLAVIQLLDIAKKLHIKKITAKTTSNNIGSQKVLEHCDFSKTLIEQDTFELINQLVHFVHYEYNL